LGLLADGYRCAGKGAAGLTVVVDALATTESTGARFWEAELYRLRGELLLMQAPGKGASRAAAAEAEACFRQAIEVARRQVAKSWELRAALSLSRLWLQQGKREEARALLTPLYGWFTEGFETADLQEARALLQELP
jgi:predicted ATPase